MNADLESGFAQSPLAPAGTRRAGAHRGAVVRLISLVLLAASFGAGSAPAAGAHEPTGFTGILAMRGDQVLAEENADRLFVPASVQKLVTVAAVLHHLGPEHRSVTRLRVSGSLVGLSRGAGDHGASDGERELRGDLVVEAAGDPTWSDELRAGDARRPLRELAREVSDAGLVRVSGDLVIDVSRFPGRAIPLDWARGDTALAFGAAPSALAIDENVVRLRIAPGAKVGEPARLSGPADLELVNGTVTVSSARHGKGTVDFLPVWGSATLVVTGEYPISEPSFVVPLAAPDPVERAARALREELEAAGVEIAGDIRIVSSPPPTGARVLGAIRSAPLADVLALVLADSHNWYAEMLLRQLALEVGGEGRLDTGLDVVRAFLEEHVGIDAVSFELDDGSGLSPYNMITPRAVVDVLRFALEQPWRQVLLDALASGPKGTLASWGPTPAIAAKTGSLRHTQTLAGVVLPSGAAPGVERIVFAVFLNHRTDERPALKREIVRRLWEWSRTPVVEAPVAASGSSGS